jgi:DNA polymerase/3'-5' exonuclease PolX
MPRHTTRSGILPIDERSWTELENSNLAQITKDLRSTRGQSLGGTGGSDASKVLSNYDKMIASAEGVIESGQARIE